LGAKEKVMRRIKLVINLAAVSVVMLAATPIASAQVYPSRPVALVAPSPAGAVTDLQARILAERMRTSLGQPIIVENVAGSGGTLGVGRVVRAQGDGYTIGIGQWSSHVSAPAIFSIKYDVLNDLEPVALLPVSRLWIVARIDFPANDLKELIAWLKANPGKASAALPGPGSGGHVSFIHFQNLTGTQFQLVPYRGGAPAMQDLMAGHVDLMCGEASQMLSYVRAGKMKAYAVLAKSRWAGAPEVPAIDEAGVPGLYISFWHGLWVPKSTPKDVIARLNAAVVDTLADPAVRQRFADLGQDIPSRDQQTPEAFRAHHKAEIEKWWPIIKAANIKVD
jgi:tripartite-type tricarboxylate transporter receptor subunit TctC